MFVLVKLQLSSTILQGIKADTLQIIKLDAITHIKKIIISIKIRIFKRLQNRIENSKKFFKKLKWIYKREHKVDKPANDMEKAE